MANRSNAWNALYGSSEDDRNKISGLGDRRTENATAADNRRFLSTQAPFATDEDASQLRSLCHKQSQSTSTRSHLYGSNPFTHSTPDHRIPGQHVQMTASTSSQRAQEMLSSKNDTYSATSSHDSSIEEPSSKRHRTLDHSAEMPWSSDMADREPEISLREDNGIAIFALKDLAEKAVASALHSPTNAQSDDETKKDAEFTFRNNMQRCEAFITALQTCLEVCKKNGRDDVVALMANRLEKVIDALNSLS